MYKNLPSSYITCNTSEFELEECGGCGGYALVKIKGPGWGWGGVSVWSSRKNILLVCSKIIPKFNISLSSHSVSLLPLFNFCDFKGVVACNHRYPPPTPPFRPATENRTYIWFKQLTGTTVWSCWIDSFIVKNFKSFFFNFVGRMKLMPRCNDVLIN